MKNHYEVLGVASEATDQQIKSAYRQLARQFHPDVNAAPGAQEKFLAIKESYETLTDPEKRRRHDQALNLHGHLRRKAEEEDEAELRAARARAKARAEEEKRQAETEAKAKWQEHRARLHRLERLLAQRRLAEAEAEARAILEIDPREAKAHAAMGDLARFKGLYTEAAKHYAYAAQFDAANDQYQRSHEEMLRAAQKAPRDEMARDPGERHPGAFLVGVFVLIVAAVYTALAKENPLTPQVAPISTWTLGQWAMFLFGGITLGATLSASDLLDSPDLGGGAVGNRINPGLALSFVGVVFFWLALALYLLVGFTQRAFNASLSRFLGFVAFAAVAFALARAGVSVTAATQTLLWSGNVIIIGTMTGWFVADVVRRSLRAS